MRNAYFTLFVLFCLCTTMTRAENWMKHLPDETYVAVVSIPGSHDSATGNGMTLPTWGQTQDIDFATQWSIGIRAFDLRPKVSDDHLQVNHGILPTELRFDDALYLLRDSLIKNTTEFAVIHLLYADGYDEDKNTYKTMLLELLGREDLKDYLVDFRADLTVGEMRGKILLLSRDKYDTKPVGGFFSNWCGYIDWNAQRNGKITGASGTNAAATLYMQDLAETHESGKLEEKMNAIRQMLDFSTTHKTNNTGQIVWVFNFASAYSKVANLFGNKISLAEGYRDNATYTHPTIIDYLSTHSGPTGIILMDYVGVDQSEGYATRGKEVVDAIIANNYKYLTYETDEMKAIKALRQELLDKITALRRQRLDIKMQIDEECPDVAKDFKTEIDAVGFTLNGIQNEINRLYKTWELPLDYTIEEAAIINELNRILEAARAAQKAYDEAQGTDIETVKTAPAGMSYRIYSVTGELLNAPKRGAVNIFKYDDGTVRKVKY